MVYVGCFSGILCGRMKKKSKNSMKPTEGKRIHSIEDVAVKREELYDSSTESRKIPWNKMGSSKGKNSPKTDSAFEAAYEGGDEHDDKFSFKREFSDFDLEAFQAKCGDFKTQYLHQEIYEDAAENKLGTADLIQSGHVSDPGMGRTTASWGSPMLKRSCSNIEAKRASRSLNAAVKSTSYDDLQVIFGSPLSVITSCSADKVMLKKRSSSQVLPSRSKKLWWRLFLWSHRNLHNPLTTEGQRITYMTLPSNRKGGYCSDTLEATSRGVEKKKKKAMEQNADRWTQNQWVAFSAGSSSLDRVGAWIHSLDDSPFCPIDEADDVPPDEAFCSTEIGECSYKKHKNKNRRTQEEFMEAKTIIQSLNSLSSVAHIAGMGLKVIPPIAPFTSLRSVNLSNNFIVQISSGSLPKSLHTLDLSRNKISTIQGLRELTKLRVLNLSYNRIARIGHGLSKCSGIKELYLCGNKMSDVEGLHRLLKLTVVDLSFNRIPTAKALGQLVANFNSLLALNLVGNPVQSNIGDDQLRKAVSSLLPRLAFFNKQPIKSQVTSDSVAKAALGTNTLNPRRKLTRRLSQGSSGSLKNGRHY